MVSLVIQDPGDSQDSRDPQDSSGEKDLKATRVIEEREAPQPEERKGPQELLDSQETRAERLMAPMVEMEREDLEELQVSPESRVLLDLLVPQGTVNPPSAPCPKFPQGLPPKTLERRDPARSEDRLRTIT